MNGHQMARWVADKNHVHLTCTAPPERGFDPINAAADAASDWWADVVRDLVEHPDHPDECNYYMGWNDHTCDCGHAAALARAKEALGD